MHLKMRDKVLMQICSENSDNMLSLVDLKSYIRLDYASIAYPTTRDFSLRDQKIPNHITFLKRRTMVNK